MCWGSAVDCDIRFPAGTPERLGSLAAAAEALHFVPIAGVHVEVEDSSGMPILLRSDAVDDGPTRLRVGSLFWWVIERGWTPTRKLSR